MFHIHDVKPFAFDDDRRAFAFAEEHKVRVAHMHGTTVVYVDVKRRERHLVQGILNVDRKQG